jgi:hypothetical protein
MECGHDLQTGHHIYASNSLSAVGNVRKYFFLRERGTNTIRFQILFKVNVNVEHTEKLKTQNP